jgi:hypothetical protein
MISSLKFARSPILGKFKVKSFLPSHYQNYEKTFV